MLGVDAEAVCGRSVESPFDMPPVLRERASLLSRLDACLESATHGAGGVALICGEAGIGKTSLLEVFAARIGAGRMLWGNCEALTTPRPLGPLHDMAATADRLRAALAADDGRGQLFSAVLSELSLPPAPVTIVFEDIHWADAATLDLITFLGRRIHRVPALLVATYRDDEPSFAQLRRVLGELPARRTTRIVVPRLSEASVAEMAASAGYASAGVYAATGGNPFFVTEVLEHGLDEGGVPATVRDAVIARAAHLCAGAHLVLHVASLVPRAITMRLLDDVAAPATEEIEACIAGGLLVAEADTLRFRHELARVAVAAAISAPRARALHAKIFCALQARAGDSIPLATVVHHAHLAGNGEAVLRLAPPAAREAATRGAHREAAAQFRVALTYAAHLPPAERAKLLSDYAVHCFEVNDLDAAIPAQQEAIALYGAEGDRQGECEVLAAHALPLVRALRNAEADDVSRRAIAIADGLIPSATQAKAYAVQSYLRMLNRDYADAITWGERAIALAQQFGDAEIAVRAATSVGAALLFVDYERGRAYLTENLERANGLRDGGGAAAEIYAMIGSASGELFAFATAERYLADGIAYAQTRDLDRIAGYMEAWQALCDMYAGRWDSAGTRANAALYRDPGNSTNRITALIALGRLRTRRGDPGAKDALNEALELATRSGTLQRLAPACGAYAEYAWLHERDAAAVRRVSAIAFDAAHKKKHPWFTGELALWLWRTGALHDAPSTCATPYALQIAGRWREAAEAWGDLGCPYERARALADGDAAAGRAALAILDRLGAAPLASSVRSAMHAAGIRSIPRGPATATREHAWGLTAREAEVLSLLGSGLRNTQIAARLVLSSRTVEHHVESILRKLDVPTRAQAVAAARRHGLIPPG